MESHVCNFLQKKKNNLEKGNKFKNFGKNCGIFSKNCEILLVIEAFPGEVFHRQCMHHLLRMKTLLILGGIFPTKEQ